MRHYHKHVYNIKYSQNFIKSSTLATKLVNEMRLSKKDTVIEIGPGTGALTKNIIGRVNKFIGVELDFNLFKDLSANFYSENVDFVNEDFLKYKLPESGDYKIIGNIPFALTADIIRRILEWRNPPVDTYLILQKEAALRLVTRDYENFFALQYKPFFESKIIKNIPSFEFNPRPNVDSMLIRIKRLSSPLIPLEDKDEYTKFVSFCFLYWKVNVKSVLKRFFTHTQLSIMAKEYGINFELKPSQITFEQWLVLFNVFKTMVAKEKKMVLNTPRNS